jgi:hypothetical protein
MGRGDDPINKRADSTQSSAVGGEKRGPPVKRRPKVFGKEGTRSRSDRVSAANVTSGGVRGIENRADSSQTQTPSRLRHPANFSGWGINPGFVAAAKHRDASAALSVWHSYCLF